MFSAPLFAIKSARPSLRHHQRVVIKIGSNVIASQSEGLHEERVRNLATSIAALRFEGREIFIVSSGAILCGREALHRSANKSVSPLVSDNLMSSDLSIKQAAAAVGQSRLMWIYEKCFAEFGITVAQILLTREDIDHPKRLANAQGTLLTLLRYGVLPIINENDTVAVDEIRMGDNDYLAGLVATRLVAATLLILLSDVDGLYTADPRTEPTATLLTEVSAMTPEIEAMAKGTRDSGGTGGMISKIHTAKQAMNDGIATLILNGGNPDFLQHAFQDHPVGTLFVPPSQTA